MAVKAREGVLREGGGCLLVTTTDNQLTGFHGAPAGQSGDSDQQRAGRAAAVCGGQRAGAERLVLPILGQWAACARSESVFM